MLTKTKSKLPSYFFEITECSNTTEKPFNYNARRYKVSLVLSNYFSINFSLCNKSKNPVANPALCYEK